VLSGEPDTARAGNLALEELFGARVVLVGPGEDVDARVAEVAGELRGDGEVPAVLPLGGSTPTGARGYLACAAELAEQLPGLDTAVVAVGSGGTMAGLVAGLGAERVLGVDTGAVPDPAERVTGLATALGATVGELRLRRDQVGEGYGALTDAAAAAMTTAARTEGLVLDPVYTGKALAGLAAAVQDGSVQPGRRTVFVHTGGLPGLFGHPYAAQLAGELLARR
jgi:L-cysteate sulfo-lyase